MNKESVTNRTGLKRSILISLITIMILALLPMNALAKVPTEAEAYSRMIALKAQYPDGTPWTNDDHYSWNAGIFSGGSGCAGFAFMLSDAAFGTDGTLRARKIENPFDYDSLRVGDILRINNNTHSVIILEKYDSKVVVAEGNYGGKVHWGREFLKEKVLQSDYYLTRYPLPTHTITFEPNGSKDTMEPQVVKDDVPTRLNPCTLTRKGYTFVEWYSTYNGYKNETYADQAEVTLNADLRLFAEWKINQYTLTYDANGGQGTMEGYTGDFGDLLRLPACAFTRAGYRFTGWNTAADGSGTAYKPAEYVNLTDNVTYYAQWEPIIRTIRFDPGAGLGEMADVTVMDGETYVLPACAFTAPAHMQFSAWSAGKPGDVITVDSDLIVTAKWEFAYCRITFDANGGTGSMEPETVVKNSPYLLPDCRFTAPENQEFDRWDAGLPDEYIDAVTEDITVKALWKDREDLPKQRIDNAKISPIRDQIRTGGPITPAVTVKLDGQVLVPDTDYTVFYADNTEVGTATVTITGIGSYTGTKSAAFTILPKKVTLSSLKAGKKSLEVKWKAGKGIDGYEIEYSLKKNFKGAKTVTVKKMKTTAATLKKLKAKKTYYVRIRAFKEVKGRKYYSEWSKVLSKKTK